MFFEILHPKKESPTTQTNKSNKIEEVTQDGEDITKEVEVEEEANQMSLDVKNVTNWTKDPLNVQRRNT